ncbi:hypothetical protein D9756_009998 [Leucocoprinus leucothites]|uniref:Uncharacterized protein n=1 Tax=Leucocoprinus leucothites TaxID=201217 RepID=A0A8H5CSV6_9AGAR|nr:hypothetical protein D9756_009998 [Leucoagaricus leucothites]
MPVKASAKTRTAQTSNASNTAECEPQLPYTQGNKEFIASLVANWFWDILKELGRYLVKKEEEKETQYSDAMKDLVNSSTFFELIIGYMQKEANRRWDHLSTELANPSNPSLGLDAIDNDQVDPLATWGGDMSRLPSPFEAPEFWQFIKQFKRPEQNQRQLSVSTSGFATPPSGSNMMPCLSNAGVNESLKFLGNPMPGGRNTSRHVSGVQGSMEQMSHSSSGFPNSVNEEDVLYSLDSQGPEPEAWASPAQLPCYRTTSDRHLVCPPIKKVQSEGEHVNQLEFGLEVSSLNFGHASSVPAISIQGCEGEMIDGSIFGLFSTPNSRKPSLTGASISRSSVELQRHNFTLDYGPQHANSSILLDNYNVPAGLACHRWTSSGKTATSTDIIDTPEPTRQIRQKSISHHAHGRVSNQVQQDPRVPAMAHNRGVSLSPLVESFAGESGPRKRRRSGT